MQEKYITSEEIILNMLVSYIEQKKDYVETYVCGIEDTIDLIFKADSARRITGIYLMNKGKVENEKTAKIISDFNNYLHMDMNSFIMLVYSYMETLLRDKITNEYCIEEYKRYRNKRKKKNNIDVSVKYILLKKDSSLNQNEEDTVHSIIQIGKTRNKIVHEFQQILKAEDILKFISGSTDYINCPLEEMRIYYNSCINMMIEIYKDFINLYKSL